MSVLNGYFWNKNKMFMSLNKSIRIEIEYCLVIWLEKKKLFSLCLVKIIQRIKAKDFISGLLLALFTSSLEQKKE